MLIIACEIGVWTVPVRDAPRGTPFEQRPQGISFGMPRRTARPTAGPSADGRRPVRAYAMAPVAPRPTASLAGS
jgi:hypothetical protein